MITTSSECDIPEYPATVNVAPETTDQSTFISEQTDDNRHTVNGVLTWDGSVVPSHIRNARFSWQDRMALSDMAAALPPEHRHSLFHKHQGELYTMPPEHLELLQQMADD